MGIKTAHRGFTVVEMVMAMAITAIVGLAVAGVSMTLSTGYAQSEDHYQAIQSSRASLMKIQSIVREAKLILASTNTAAAFWAADLNGDGKLNRKELVLVTYDSSTRELRQVTLKSGTLSGSDDVLALSDVATVASVASRLAQDPWYESQLLATDVRSFIVSVSPDAPKATSLNISFTVGSDAQSITLRSTVVLRADKTANVGTSKGQWVLI